MQALRAIALALAITACACMDEAGPSSGPSTPRPPQRDHSCVARLDDAFAAQSMANVRVRLRGPMHDNRQPAYKSIAEVSKPLSVSAEVELDMLIDGMIADMHLVHMRSEGPIRGSVYMMSSIDFANAIGRSMFRIIMRVYGEPTEPYYWSVELFEAILEFIFCHKSYVVKLVMHDGTIQYLHDVIPMLATTIDSAIAFQFSLMHNHPFVHQHVQSLAQLSIDWAVADAVGPLHNVVHNQAVTIADLQDELMAWDYITGGEVPEPAQQYTMDDDIVVPGTPPQVAQPFVNVLPPVESILPAEIQAAVDAFGDEPYASDTPMPYGHPAALIDFSDEEGVACG